MIARSKSVYFTRIEFNKTVFTSDSKGEPVKNKVFLSELQTILKGRCEHADLSEKWRYTQALRKLENFDVRRSLSGYITERHRLSVLRLKQNP